MTLKASASLAGDWSLSTSMAFDWNAAAGDELSIGSVSATDGTSTLTFGANHGLGAAGLDARLQGVAAGKEAKTADVTISSSMGGVDLSVSMDDAAGGNTEIGVATSAGGADISAGFIVAGDDQGDYSLSVATSAGGADLSFSTSSVDGDVDYDISASMAVSGIDVTVATDEASLWSVDASYTMGDLTLSAGTTGADGNDYTLGVAYSMGEVAVAFTTDEASAWTASIDYTSGAITAGVSMEAGADAEITLSYDLGGGAVVSAGMVADGTYAAVAYDLGGGAELVASFASAIIGDSYEKGTTVGVSFDF
jgi:hypothetical protein